jgi:ribosomal protein S18 acetylase RimI-like enzyme
MEIELRDAGQADASAIVRLICEHDASPLDERCAARYLASPGACVLLAVAENEVVGLLSCSVRPDLFHAGPVGLIEELIVSEAWRGRGVGKAMLAEALSRLAARGCVEVAASVMPENARAIALCRAHGLVEEALLLERHFTPTT